MSLSSSTSYSSKGWGREYKSMVRWYEFFCENFRYSFFIIYCLFRHQPRICLWGEGENKSLIWGRMIGFFFAIYNSFLRFYLCFFLTISFVVNLVLVCGVRGDTINKVGKDMWLKHLLCLPIISNYCWQLWGRGVNLKCFYKQKKKNPKIVSSGVKYLWIFIRLS